MSKPIPFRPDDESAAIIGDYKKDRQISNRNLAINQIIHEVKQYELLRAEKKEQILKIMRDFNIRLKELE